MQPVSARADRGLERALIANLAIHALAMLGMVAFLLPALPGGGGFTDAERASYIASHPWFFRLGWLPWQLCAVCDLWLAIAMVRVAWLPRWGTSFVLLFTCAAVVPDQWAQALWITRGVDLASGDLATYLAFEARVFPLTAGWGACFYTAAALFWTYSFARAGTWSRWLTWLSIPLWITMGFAVIAPLLPLSARPSPKLVGAANALGFAQLEVWLALVTEAVLRRARPDERSGRLAPWRHPSTNPLARVIDVFANSRLFGALLEPLPEATMVSDIRDVLYVNYVVPRERVEELVPQGLELQRLGPRGAYALFTFLSFRHGHFGPAFLGPLRKLFPSPVQTNWRIHVVDPRTGTKGITFVPNAIDSTLLALAARMMTEGMPMHVLHEADVSHRDEVTRLLLSPGEGSAPDAKVEARDIAAPEMVGVWRECWTTAEDFLAYCVPQDRAMATQPLRHRVSRQEIHLGIPLGDCVFVSGTIESQAARAIVGDAEPVCFRVASVSFRFSQESYDSMP